MHVLTPARHQVAPLFVVLLAVAACGQENGRTHAFAEGSATVQELLLHYDPDACASWLPTCVDLLRALPTDVRITVAVAGEDQARAFGASLQSRGLRLPEVVEVSGPLTCWARDRTLAVAVGNAPMLCQPCPQGVQDDYVGDLTVAPSLAEARAWSCEQAWLQFEGGDVVCSGARAFIGQGTIAANLGQAERAEVVTAFARLLGREVVVVGDDRGTPCEHLDMFLTVLDSNTVVLGEPLWGAELIAQVDPAQLPTFDEWTPEVARDVAPLYQGIAADLRARGLTVLRAPIVHGVAGRVLTWNNCLVELRGGRRRVYMPVYEIAALDQAAADVYRAADCTVFPIRARGIIEDGGAVRCITNVVRWRQDLPRLPRNGRG